MKTLEEILKFAEKNGACETQLVPFKKAIESGNTLLAWQIILGNIGWLTRKRIIIDVHFIEKHAAGIGVKYFTTGEIEVSGHYKNGRLDGELKRYYISGKLWEISFYKNGELDGELKRYYENGKIFRTRMYVNGIENGECRSYSSSGELEYILIYKNDAIVDILEPMELTEGEMCFEM